MTKPAMGEGAKSVAKRKSPAFSFYPADWLSSARVTAMTSEEEGAYIRLLCYAWGDPDCSLPDDDEILASLSRLGSRWNKCSAKIKSCFTSNDKKPGKLFNERLLLERKRQKENSRKRSEAGVKSGAARRKVSNKCSTDVEQNANKDETKTNLSSSSSISSVFESKREEENPLNPPFDSPPRGSLNRTRAEMIPIPAVLDAPAFREQWATWTAYFLKVQPTTPQMTFEQQLIQLARWGPAKAVASMQVSITNGWKMLKDPDERHGKPNNNLSAGRMYDPQSAGGDF